MLNIVVTHLLPLSGTLLAYHVIFPLSPLTYSS